MLESRPDVAPFDERQEETVKHVSGSAEALARRRQNLMVGAAGGLACLFFVLDLLLPLGLADAVLYSAVVFLSAASRYRRLPVVTATACSLLTFIAAPFSPRVPGLAFPSGLNGGTTCSACSVSGPRSPSCISAAAPNGC